MAINVTLGEKPYNMLDVVPSGCDIDLPNLKLRLALEGIDITTPVHGNLICVVHPQHGMTHFNSWGTLLDHCNENWKTTYWGPTFGGVSVTYDVDVVDRNAYFIGKGGLDADSPGADSCGGGVPVSDHL